MFESNIENIIFFSYFLSSFWMTAVIWFVQLVHYPSFRYIELSNMIKFSTFHQQSISIIVMPAMLIELFTIILLLSITGFSGSYIIQLVLLLLIWGSTFLLSVPCHSKLITTPDNETVEKLIKTNWFRTILWTLKFVLIINLI